jgi:hypothetical protein
MDERQVKRFALVTTIGNFFVQKGRQRMGKKYFFKKLELEGPGKDNCNQILVFCIKKNLIHMKI